MRPSLISIIATSVLCQTNPFTQLTNSACYGLAWHQPREECAEGLTRCEVWPNNRTVCANLQSDPNHCKYCGSTCSDDRPGMALECRDAVCVCVSTGTQRCAGHLSCPDFQINVFSCGSCNNWCSENQECRKGQCRNCPRSTMGCHDYDGIRGCIDVLRSKDNCGDCGRQCPSDSLSCKNGKCISPKAKSYCERSSYCIDLANDPTHCGTCDNKCPPGQACKCGRCGACPAGQLACRTDAQPAIFPCIDVLSDNQNCGTCGRHCDAGSQCQNGDCTCPAGHIACGDRVASCIDPMTNPSFCGSCNVSCGDGTCTRGVCTSCEVGYVFCDGECRNVSSDDRHCGGCRQFCENEGEFCNNGTCTRHTCPEGEAWCGDNLTGKCVNWRSDPLNCGECMVRCDEDQTCVNGSCE
ncbi:hypothetical protein CC85DRAFT_313224 [Cutaneotrichosporon oleaginosum]|uniref:TNFR-Cys domain-containing protein n=1 Tax=Cutaneotrichosporon oleaginosum TaxID=879819 RepID=A0A0J1AZ23_9TREE|nr:uncharacterized protein CC85DRAFT_313224 [Cutaneotrichosporon oleaginosum]KLT40579.1 hypothetical protein CC85DRAFT_313224 [Cutaneotrichosporon oleaginosum]TXT03905.1 hypothetical protein COLE_07602 [Cutaneotrichosporon oleaginosum]